MGLETSWRRLWRQLLGGEGSSKRRTGASEDDLDRIALATCLWSLDNDPHGAEVPLHLVLLNLMEDSPGHVARLMRSLPTCATPWEDVIALLEVGNWRPHLVALASSLLLPPRADGIRALWSCIDRGSWVSPQIAAGLFLMDERFPDHALERIRSRCSRPPISESMIAPNAPRNDAKALSALLRLSHDAPVLEPALGEAEADPEVAAILRDDLAGGAAIAIHWRSRIVEVYAENGVRLAPRFQS